MLSNVIQPHHRLYPQAKKIQNVFSPSSHLECSLRLHPLATRTECTTNTFHTLNALLLTSASCWEAWVCSGPLNTSTALATHWFHWDAANMFTFREQANEPSPIMMKFLSSFRQAVLNCTCIPQKPVNVASLSFSSYLFAV